MTEEIIVDGVNVAGCEHLTEIQGCWLSTCDYLPYKGNITNQLCKYNNCYYKQLKRLQEKYDTLTNKFFNSETDKTRLEQENKALKDNNNHLQVIIDDGRAENKRFREENEELKELNKKICEDWEKEIKVYWNALEEIRILATKNVSIESFVKIQNKINEVLGEKSET